MRSLEKNPFFNAKSVLNLKVAAGKQSTFSVLNQVLNQVLNLKVAAGKQPAKEPVKKDAPKEPQSLLRAAAFQADAETIPNQGSLALFIQHAYRDRPRLYRIRFMRGK